MNAADTSASRAIADCTALTVVSRSRTTAEIETFISDVSTTRTNIAIASRTASSFWRPRTRSEPPIPGPPAMGTSHPVSAHSRPTQVNVAVVEDSGIIPRG
jgi:hypothetical protein